MKKILSIFLLSIIAIVGIGATVQADGEIELYPYDQIDCLQALETCTATKVGDSHWDLTFNGYNYNFVGSAVRYASDFDDANSDGFIDATEMTANGWPSFGEMIFNNTMSEIELSTLNARTDLAGNVVNRIYVYFDETGALQMFEDHYVNRYDLFDDAGTWRFATQAEIDAVATAEGVRDAAATVLADEQATLATLTPATPEHDAQLLVVSAAQTALDGAQAALDALLVTTKLNVPIRIKVDAVDSRGYVMEPVVALAWRALGTEATDPVADQSDLIAGDPNNVVIPAGWTTVSFGTLDRNGTNEATMDFISAMVGVITGETTADPAMFVWEEQPAMFSGITALDNDPASAGTQIIIDYNAAFDLPNTVTASWMNMFDDTNVDDIIASTEMLDFDVVISQDGVDLETITFTYDGVAEAYTASAAVSVIDSSEFGAGYVATYMVTTPEGVEKESVVEIAVGVLPPSFSGVESRYIDENTMIDLMEGITADDGYGNDLTDSIMLTAPEGFNPYSPNPGVYEIDLTFTHNIFIPGVTPDLFFIEDNSVQSGGVDMEHYYTWDPTINLNPDKNVSECGATCVWTDVTNFRDATTGWSSVVVLIGADGKLDFMYERYAWTFTDENGFQQAGSEADFLAWQAAVEIEAGGAIIGSHGTSGAGYYLRQVEYDTDVTLTFDLVEDFSYDIVTDASYMLTVDDTTNPNALVVSEEYMIEAGEYSDIDDAILANVVAFDNYDMPEDLAIYVSDNGGLQLDTVGTYTVEVTVEDMAGNAAMAEFDVQVVAAPVILTAAEVQALIDAAVADAVDGLLDEAAVDAIVDAAVAGALTEADVQALIDASQPEDTGCGSSLAIGSSLVGIFALFGGTGLFFIRRRKH